MSAAPPLLLIGLIIYLGAEEGGFFPEDTAAVAKFHDARDILAGAPQGDQAVECRRGAHAVLLAKSLTLDSQQPRRAGGGASLPPAQLPRGRQEGPFPALSRDYRRQVGAPLPLECVETLNFLGLGIL